MNVDASARYKCATQIILAPSFRAASPIEPKVTQATPPEPFDPDLQNQDRPTTARLKTLVARHGAISHQNLWELAHCRETSHLMPNLMRHSAPVLRLVGLTSEQNGGTSRQYRAQLPHGCAMSRCLIQRTDRRGGKTVCRKEALHQCTRTLRLRTRTMRLCLETLAGGGLMAQRLGGACASSSPDRDVSAR